MSFEIQVHPVAHEQPVLREVQGDPRGCRRNHRPHPEEFEQHERSMRLTLIAPANENMYLIFMQYLFFCKLCFRQFQLQTKVTKNK